MDLRDPTPADADRLVALANSSMTASYRLSPQQIEQITTAEFGLAAIEDKIQDESTVLRVSETDAGDEAARIAGYVEATLDELWGTLHWLFVDPEHRGQGIGTELYEACMAELAAAGAEYRRARVLEANTDGGQFFEQLGLERTGDRRIEVGNEARIEYTYADPDVSEATTAATQQARDVSDHELPETDTQGDRTTATTADGQQVFLDTDARESGTEAPFFTVYADATFAEQHGYYCSNCGSLDVSVDSADRFECPDCGNTHASRSERSTDDAYL